LARLCSDEVSGPPTGYPSDIAAGPRGHYVIMASSNCSLLIKSLAVSELMMPADFPPLEHPTDDSLSAVMEAVGKVVTEFFGILRLTVSHHHGK
jgi:hypothetical protein